MLIAVRRAKGERPARQPHQVHQPETLPSISKSRINSRQLVPLPQISLYHLKVRIYHTRSGLHFRTIARAMPCIFVLLLVSNDLEITRF